jgi:hypothetical protein
MVKDTRKIRMNEGRRMSDSRLKAYEAEESNRS